MRCAICERNFDESQLYRGIYEGDITKICENCANLEGIPLINKPTKEQILKAEQRESVRERMMKISGLGKMRYISPEQTVATRHLSKMRMPIRPDKEPDSLAKNYNWQIQIARRRLKMTQKQLAEKIGVSEFLIQDLEKGVLPKNYQVVIKAIEKILDIDIIKIPENNKIITRSPVARPAEAEESVDKKKGFFSRIFGKKKVTQEQINEVMQKEHVEPTVTQKEEVKIKQEKIQEITPNMRLHKKKDVTLNDLIDAKREKDKLTSQKDKKDVKITPMTGKDIEIED